MCPFIISCHQVSNSNPRISVIKIQVKSVTHNVSGPFECVGNFQVKGENILFQTRWMECPETGSDLPITNVSRIESKTVYNL